MIPTAGPATACSIEEVAAGLNKTSWICSRVIGQNRAGTHFTGQMPTNMRFWATVRAWDCPPEAVEQDCNLFPRASSNQQFLLLSVSGIPPC
jgi:hypothetical protein